MSINPGLQNSGSPSTPIPTSTPSTPTISMVVVAEVPIITMAQNIVNAHPTTSNPFGSFGHSQGYNVQCIPMDSSPFSYGMPNFTSQFLNSIPAACPNVALGLGAETLLFSFSGSQIL
jgi:hypothetical protein